KLIEKQRLASAEHSITSADSIEAKETAEAAKANSAAKIAELDAQLAPAEAELQPKINALAAARKAAVAAEEAGPEAGGGAHAVARAPEPVSVFISRKTQRLYVRKRLSLSLTSRSLSGIPIYRLARTSSRPRSAAEARETCSGALFRWLDRK